MHPCRLYFASVIGFLLHTLSASQRVLYGTTGKVSEGSVLYRIDPETGRGTRINRITYQSRALTVNGMAFDTTLRQFGGRMYIHTGPFSPNYPNTLFTVDLENGIAALVGETELPRTSELAVDQFGDVYGWNLGGLNQRIDDLVSFPLDGSGALLFGNSGIDTDGNIGIDFDRQDAGTLYMVNFVGGQGEIVALSTATGAGMTLRHIATNAFPCSGGKFDPDSSPLQYWCAEDDVDGGVNLNARIQVIDFVTGQVNKTFVSNMDNLCTVAWTFESTPMPSALPSFAPTAVPTNSPTEIPTLAPVTMAPSVSQAPSQALPEGFLPASFWYWLISFIIGILVLQGSGVTIPQATDP